MKKCDTVVLAVLYPGIEPYLGDYFSSIQSQSSTKFELLLYLDGFNKSIDIPNNVRVHTIKNSKIKSPAKIREYCIQYSKKSGYKKIIFSDADDYFSETRVEQSNTMLEQFDIVYNDIVLVNETGERISENLFESRIFKPLTNSWESLLKSNKLGFTHTGIRTDFFTELKIPETIAVDWVLFSILLKLTNKIKFIKNVQTYYRQTSSSMSGLFAEFDDKKLNYGIKVKLDHFLSLKMSLYFKDQQDNIIINNETNDLIKLKEKLKENEFKESYIKKVRMNQAKFKNGWWADILNINELERL